MIEAVGWAASTLLLAIAALAIAANWALLLRQSLAGQSGPSMVSVVGGVFGRVGLVVLPVGGWTVGAWTPLILDPTCLPAVVVTRLRRSAVERLANLPCPRCGTVVGIDGAARATREWSERMRAAHEHAREHGWWIRGDGSWHFRCPSCGAALMFSPVGVSVHVDEHSPVSPDSVEPRYHLRPPQRARAGTLDDVPDEPSRVPPAPRSRPDRGGDPRRPLDRAWSPPPAVLRGRSGAHVDEALDLGAQHLDALGDVRQTGPNLNVVLLADGPDAARRGTEACPEGV
jgi:predicted RNA-binding Zn-ribbon protein involved in translation (DUF1610 family)